MEPHSNGLAPAGSVSVDDILKLDTLDYKDVPVPKWGCYVTIRTLTAREVERIRATARRPDGKGGQTFDQELSNQMVLATAVVKPAFTLNQVKSLYEQSFAVIAPIIDAINALNGMAGGDEEAAVADAAKSPATDPDPAPAL